MRLPKDVYKRQTVSCQNHYLNNISIVVYLFLNCDVITFAKYKKTPDVRWALF